MANLTKIYLLNVPLESDYQHSLYFGSKAAQLSYFQGKIVKSFENCSYQRKDRLIRVPAQYDELYGCNYIMYQNSDYSDKWFFCFIERLEYINDGRTDVYIKTDVIQTWMFDYTLKPSFVEREHVNDDTLGLHTIDEGLATGEYICNDKDTVGADEPKDLCWVLATTANPWNGKDESGGMYHGLYSGARYYKYKTVETLNAAIKNLSDEGKMDSIVALFIAPSIDVIRVEDANADEVANGIYKQYSVVETQVPSKMECAVDKQTTLDGYTPRNKKLLCYPYNYLLASNNAGGSATYRYEYFSDLTCRLNRYVVLTPGMSIKLIPQNYKNVEENHIEGLVGGKYPICAFVGDAFTNWMTQNSVNNALGVGGGLLSTGVGIAALLGAPLTGGISTAVAGGMIAGGLGSIVKTLGGVAQATVMPDQARGDINSGDVSTSLGANCFHLYKMSIKKEFAKIIDGFFDMYGYKCHEVKVPNKNHRENYWYTKTIDANIHGAIPMEDIEQIKDCYNAGITFWKNASNFRNYSVSNKIV